MHEFFTKLQTEKITRRQFLVYCGVFLLTLTGISGLLSSLKSLEISPRPKAKQGFGSGPYGV